MLEADRRLLDSTGVLGRGGMSACLCETSEDTSKEAKRLKSLEDEIAPLK